MGGQLRDKRIVQSRIWLDPSAQPIPPFDFDYSYPITVYEAVKRSMDDNSNNLLEELDSIYRLIADKQEKVEPGTPGYIMTWSGVRGQIGSMEVVKSINPDASKRSHQKVVSERALGDILDSKLSSKIFNQHVDDTSSHITDVERQRWNSMAPLSTLQSHIANGTLHITDTERQRWNQKADQDIVDGHIYDINNPHNVTAHQTGTYTRKEIDSMFENLRESFFNYMNIEWDERTAQASLKEYHPTNWNPNYILQFGDTLPDVPDSSNTYFALKPATDYENAESQDCIIYCKRPGLVWQEVGFQSMNTGDMVIRFPDTTMFVWVQGKFLQLFTGTDPNGSPIGESEMMWRPILSPEGELSWVRSKEIVAPTPFIIKGEDGKTPVKGVDYVDGEDGQGVAIGGLAGQVLVKLTDENFDTTWKTLSEILGDIVISGDTLPDNIVSWDQIKDRPNIYDEFGDHEDGFIHQKFITNQFEIINNRFVEIQQNIESSNLGSISSDLYEHINDRENPHRVTAAQIGAITLSQFIGHTQNYSNPHNVTAEQIGLGNVNNTADIDKPISNAVREEFNKLKQLVENMGGDVTELNYIVNAMYKKDKGVLVFVFRDGTEMTVNIPITEVFNTMYFDESDKTLVIVLPDNTEHKIEVGSMIQTYSGTVSDNIQVSVNDDHTISATVVPGSIGDLEIKPSVNLRSSPTTTTQPISDRSTRIATTEFVHNQVIDNLISYDTARPLSANMGRILNQKKADIEDLLEIIADIEGVDVIDNLQSSSPIAALSANMGRELDLTKAPRVHTSESGTTYGRATINLFGHTRASSVDPLMDGTAFRGTDDGYYSRGDHRHPTDITRSPMHWPDVEHGQYAFTGEPRSTLPPENSNDNRIATTEWVRRSGVGPLCGVCDTLSGVPNKVVELKHTFMDPIKFVRQIGSTVVVTFANTDLSNGGPCSMEEYENNVGSTNPPPEPIMPPGRDVCKSDCNDLSMQKINQLYDGQAVQDTTTDDKYCGQFTPAKINNMYDGIVTDNGDIDDENCGGITAAQINQYYDGGARQIVESSDDPDNGISLLSNEDEGIQLFAEDPINNSKVNLQIIPGIVTLNVHGTGFAPIIFDGKPIVNGMIKANRTYIFTYDGFNWRLMNPSGIHTLPDDDFSNAYVSSEWVRRNSNSVFKGNCRAAGNEKIKTVILLSDFMEDPVFIRQTGSTIAVTFSNDDTVTTGTQLDVHRSGAAAVLYGGRPIIPGMIRANYTYIFTFNGISWCLLNPSAIHTLPDDDNTNAIISAVWARKNLNPVFKGTSSTAGSTKIKVATLESDFMTSPVFTRQKGSIVTIKFTYNDTCTSGTQMNVHGSGAANVTFGAKAIIPGMIKANHSYVFAFDGSNWCLLNPSGIHPLSDSDNSNSYVSSEWVRKNLNSVFSGVCTTASTTAAKTATLKSDFMANPVFTRQQGSTIAIKFSNTDTSTSATTLNVHGSGAASITYGGTPIVANMLKAGYTHLFVFDGSSWCLLNPAASFEISDVDNSNNFITSNWARSNLTSVYSGSSTTSSTTADKVATVKSPNGGTPVFLKNVGVTVAITFTYEDRSGSTPTTLNVNDTGATRILYAGLALRDGYIGANGTHMFVFDGTYWRLINPMDKLYSPGGITIGPGGSNPTPSNVVKKAISKHTGYNGFTTQGSYDITSNGCVRCAQFAVAYTPIETDDVVVTVSTESDAWGARMGDGTIVKLSSPSVLNACATGCNIQFTMESRYPSNSPCQLVYMTNKAYINVKPR